jgi:chitinase
MRKRVPLPEFLTDTTEPQRSRRRSRLRAKRRRLSLVRSVAVLAGVVGFIGGTASLAQGAWARLNPKDEVTWFGSYVDVTLEPKTAFEALQTPGASTFVLGFVVADDVDRCQPSWGTFYSLDGAADELALDRRLVRLRDRGGEPIVSFGGAVNDELSVACTDQTKLTAAYRSVIERYRSRIIDLDIEGSALTDTAAHKRRAVALRKLQDEAKAAGRSLDIWLTLPVSPTGLPESAVALVDEILRSKVDLTGVNVMTMNYGGSRPNDMSMAEANRRALFATARQLDGAYRRNGTRLVSKELWRKIGATPMLGQNDVPTDRFTVGDARELTAFSRRYGLGRLSMWSVDRDHPCANGETSTRVSNTCSGTKQKHWEFLRLLGGEAVANRPAEAEQPDENTTVTPQRGGITRDDPTKAPYPIWRATKAYELGDKVVWYGNVYEAKWYARGASPDEPVVKEWDSPWQYLGPVLPTDVPWSSRLLKPGTYPAWDSSAVYQGGAVVQSEGRAFRARHWSRGVPPDPDPDEPWAGPWTVLPILNGPAASTPGQAQARDQKVDQSDRGAGPPRTASPKYRSDDL